MPGWLIINMTETAQFGRFPPLVVEGVVLPELDKWRKSMFIRIPTKDFNIPPFPAQMWEDLLDAIERLASEREDRLNVMFCCVGGHGRTGMGLSIMAGLTIAQDEDPITFVRERYCQEAVENMRQAKYVCSVTGCFTYLGEKDFKKTAGYSTSKVNYTSSFSGNKGQTK